MQRAPKPSDNDAFASDKAGNLLDSPISIIYKKDIFQADKTKNFYYARTSTTFSICIMFLIGV